MGPFMPTDDVCAAIGNAGGGVTELSAMVGAVRMSELAAEVAARWKVIEPRITVICESRWGNNAPSVATAAQDVVREEVLPSLALVEALRLMHSNRRIAVVVFNETESYPTRAAVKWARSARVPCVLLHHGANLNRHYTVSGNMLNVDRILTFGERGTLSEMDRGVPRERLQVTGNPAWADFPGLRARRTEIGKAVREEMSLAERSPLIVFATTWFAKLTVMSDQSIVYRTLAPVLAACRVLRERGRSFSLVVKVRSDNTLAERERFARLGKEVGFTDAIYQESGLERLLAAANVFVGPDTGAIVEAMILGVPSVNVSVPDSWMLGPAFGADDGIPSIQWTQPQALADELDRLLFSEPHRNAALAVADARLPVLAGPLDGQAASRVADEVLRMIGGNTGSVAKVNRED
jgi:O-antigen biosynthesis protein